MVEPKSRSPRNQARDRVFSSRDDDSPSRLFRFELERTFRQLEIIDNERQKVHAYQRKSYHAELDARDMAATKAHMAAIELASAKHEAIREEAEAVLNAHKKEQEEIERRRLEEERLQAEREAFEKAEKERLLLLDLERRKREQKEREEAAQRQAMRALEERKKAEAEAERRRQEQIALDKKRQEEKEASEKDKKEKNEASEKARREEESRKQAEAEAQAQSQAQTQAQSPTTTQQALTTSAPGPTAEQKAVHRSYLDLHKKLKTFRKEFWDATRKDANLKPHVGDMRRAMRTSVGQLTEDKVGNKKATERIKLAIQQSLKQIPSPQISLSEYLPSHVQLQNPNTTIPSLTVYLISVFSKAIVNAFVGECAVNTKAAEPIGTLVAQVFSLNELQHPNSNSSDRSISLIHILMAKFHAVAPMLFGVIGPETTQQGKLLLGWRREESPNNPGSKSFVLEQRQYERLTGLGAGYASIALRNFSRTSLTNPFPPKNFWSTMASIVNTPDERVQPCQLVILKAMLENTAIDRFVLFFGAPGVGVLRDALVTLPSRLPDALRNRPEAKALVLMCDALVKNRHFRLD